MIMGNEKGLVLTEDWLDPRKKQGGEYSLHRNYDYGGGLLYARYETGNNKRKLLKDTEPIAVGVTAFLAHTDMSETSLRDYLDNNLDFDIYELYQKYFSIRFRVYQKINQRKTKSEGRLNDEELVQIFALNHLEEEKEYLQRSEEYFSNAPVGPTPEVKKKLQGFAGDYLEWVKQEKIRTNGLTRGLKSNLSDAQLKKLHKEMDGTFVKSNEDSFVRALSTKGHVEPVLWIFKSERGRTVGEPNKTALRAFLEFLLNPGNIEANETIPQEHPFTGETFLPIQIGKRSNPDELKTFKYWFQEMLG